MAQASNFPLEVLYLRNSDIPHYVEDGVVDLAIIGENTVIEKRADVSKLLDLGFSGCRVSIAIDVYKRQRLTRKQHIPVIPKVGWTR